MDQAYLDSVVKAKKILAEADRDDKNRVKDDGTKWALGDLMVELWPRKDGTKEEASAIQEQLLSFAQEINYSPAMVKDWYYVSEQWPPAERVLGKSHAQHSKLRSRVDKGWALLGIHPGSDDGLEPLKGLNQGQIRKVEKVLQAIDALDGESSAVLDAVVKRLTPKMQKPANKIITALRSREKQAKLEAEAWRKRRSALAVVYEHQAFLLNAAARTQALVDFAAELQAQGDRDYLRKVIEGTVFVNQKALEDLLDVLYAPVNEKPDALDVDSEIVRQRQQLAG